MGRTLGALLAGAIFGLGLVVSGMVDPRRVRGFLDVTGQWDPTLLFVMAGALLVTGVGYRLVFVRARPLFDSRFFVPAGRVVDARLVGGSLMFGIGWGIAGLCPGPALVGVATASPGVLVFTVAMAAGMRLHELLEHRRRGTPAGRAG